jgi:hypothetical protein
MNNRYLKITPADLANELGISCSNYTIVWDTHECIAQPCPDDEGMIEIIIPEFCENTCLTGSVECFDECGRYKQFFKICLCEEDGDCSGCEKCLNFLCVSKCEEGQVCTSLDKCGECNDENPCTGGQICVAGGCQCPPSKPYKNLNGKCINCETDEQCADDEICGEDGCTKVICEEGYVDPVTKECVTCVLDEHCGNNASCDGNRNCVCDPGYVKDANGNCVLAPECTDNSECGACETCDITSGKCRPKKCPEGQVCHPTYGCIPLCDCNNPTNCNSKSACVNVGNGACGCVPCEESCTAGCGDGCYCSEYIDPDNCRPKKCSNPCTSGNDCGNGCGCDTEISTCVDCDSLTEDECGKVLGCIFAGGTCTDDTTCTGDCADYTDCGDTCGCAETGCVKCAELSLEDCGNTNGCKVLNGLCVPDRPEDCEDTFTFTKDDVNCNLEINGTIVDGCNCSTLSTVSFLNSIVDNEDDFTFDIKVELRKGSATSNTYTLFPLLGDDTNEDIAENEEPTIGSIELQHTIFYDIYAYDEDRDDYFYVETISVPQQPVLRSFAGKDNVTISSLVFPKIGSGTEIQKVNRIEAKIIQKTNFSFVNDCTYRTPKTLATYYYSNNSLFTRVINGIPNISVGYLTSADQRAPLHAYYKSTDGNFGDDPFRKSYIPLVLNSNEDILYGPADYETAYPLVSPQGKITSNRFYLATRDCGCERTLDIGKLVFCNPMELEHEMSDCNKTVTIQTPFDPCEVNQDLRQWGYDPLTDEQVKYDLYLNGQKVQTFKHDQDFGMVKDGTTQTMFGNYSLPSNLPITEVRLKINHDTQGSCDLVYTYENLANFTPQVDFICETFTNDYNLQFAVGYESFTISSISDGTNTYNPSNGFITVGSLVNNQDYSLEFTLSNGCVVTKQYNYQCCSGLTADSTVTPNFNTLLNEVAITISGGNAPYTVVNTLPNGDIVNGQSVVTDQTGTMSTVVNDDRGCSVQFNTVLNIITEYSVVVPANVAICTGDIYTAEVTVSPSNGTIALHYELNTVAQTPITVPLNGTVDLGSYGNTTTINVTKLVVNGEDITIGQQFTITEVTAATASLTGPQYICAGELITIEVEGTLGSTVIINNGVSDIQTVVLDVSCSGNPSNGCKSFTVTPIATTTYGITQITVNSGGSSCNFNSASTYIVTVETAAQYSVGSQVCNGGLTEYDIDVTFDSTPFAFALSNGNATFVVNGLIYTITIPSGEGTNITYESANGGCEESIVLGSFDCDCPADNTYPALTISSTEFAFSADPVNVLLQTTPPYKIKVFNSDNSTLIIDSASSNLNYNYLPLMGVSQVKTFYAVIYNDADGCEKSSQAFTIQRYDELQITSMQSDGNSLYVGDATTLIPIITGGSGTRTYAWRKGSPAGTVISTNLNYAISNAQLSDGDIYYFTVTDTVTGETDQFPVDIRVTDVTIGYTLPGDYDCGTNELTISITANPAINLTNNYVTVKVYVAGSGTPVGILGNDLQGGNNASITVPVPAGQEETFTYKWGVGTFAAADTIGIDIDTMPTCCPAELVPPGNITYLNQCGNINLSDPRFIEVRVNKADWIGAGTPVLSTAAVVLTSVTSNGTYWFFELIADQGTISYDLTDDIDGCSQTVAGVDTDVCCAVTNTLSIADVTPVKVGAAAHDMHHLEGVAVRNCAGTVISLFGGIDGGDSTGDLFILSNTSGCTDNDLITNNTNILDVIDAAELQTIVNANLALNGFSATATFDGTTLTITDNAGDLNSLIVLTQYKVIPGGCVITVNSDNESFNDAKF